MSKKLSLSLFIITLAILFVPIFVANAQYGIDVTADQTIIQKFKDVSLQTMVGNLLGGVLSMVGIIFFALMVYGGIIWMSAAGNQEREKKAGGIMVGATIGVVLVLSSYVLVGFLFDKTGEGLTASTPTTVATPTITTTTTPPGGLVKKCEVKNDEAGDFCNALDDNLCNGEVCDYDSEIESCIASANSEDICSSQTEAGPCVLGQRASICEWK